MTSCIRVNSSPFPAAGRRGGAGGRCVQEGWFEKVLARVLSPVSSESDEHAMRSSAQKADKLVEVVACLQSPTCGLARNRESHMIS